MPILPPKLVLTEHARKRYRERWRPRWKRRDADAELQTHLATARFVEADGCYLIYETCRGALLVVANEVWTAAGFGKKTFACITCLAERLGRRLVAADFVDVPINAGVLYGLAEAERAKHPCLDCRRMHAAGAPCKARDDDGYY